MENLRNLIAVKGFLTIGKASDYYNGDNLIKIEAYFDKDKNKTPFVDSQSDFGIRSIYVFPLYII